MSEVIKSKDTVIIELLDRLHKSGKIYINNIGYKNTKININGKDYGQAKFREYLSSGQYFIDNPEDLKIYSDNFNEVRLAFNSNLLLSNWLESKKEESKRAEIIDAKKNAGIYDLSSLKPIVDIKTGDIILWDNEIEDISVTSYKAYKNALGPTTISNELKIAPYPVAVFDYDPYNLDRTAEVIVDNKKIMQINTYNAPDWRYLEVEPAVHADIMKFIKHLFPVPKDRKIIFSFLKKSILERVAHIMVLEGKRAVGKNIFVEHIVAPLVGHKYFAKAPKGFFESRFQDILVNNRLIFFDELEAKDSKAMNDIKRLANHTQGVERKGKDLAQYRAYYSCIANTNDPQAFPVEFDERRIYFPEITDTRLNNLWNKKEIKAFTKLLEDPVIISQLGHYILEMPYDEDFDTENAYINDKFLKMVEVNLGPARSYIVDRVLNFEGPDTYIEYFDLKEDYLDHGTGRFLSETNFNLFIENFLYMGKPLGHCKKVEGKSRFYINQELNV